MEDKLPSTPKAEVDIEGQKLAGSPRTSIPLSQLGCSAWARTFGELWRRVRLEVVVEWPLLKARWRVLLFGLIMQYVHGIFTQLAHRMHQPQEEPLHDVGFDLTPELGPDKHWVSETIFGIAFATFVLWTFTPFVLQRKRFYTAVMWPRLLMVLVVCQALRIVTFSVTQLPGPSFHCRAGEPTARRPWPTHWSGHIIVDVGRQVSKSCGDLIFSSHTTFMLTGILAYNEYGSLRLMKAAAWALGVVLSTLIVASRKHYTVDVVIAWYTVPLVFYTMYRRWTTRRPMSDFIVGGGSGTSAFDDVDGCEMELEEVFMDRDGALLSCMEAGLKPSGGAQPRSSTLKICVRAPHEDRRLLNGHGNGHNGSANGLNGHANGHHSMHGSYASLNGLNGHGVVHVTALGMGMGTGKLGGGKEGKEKAEGECCNGGSGDVSGNGNVGGNGGGGGNGNGRSGSSAPSRGSRSASDTSPQQDKADGSQH